MLAGYGGSMYLSNKCSCESNATLEKFDYMLSIPGGPDFRFLGV